jgi:peptide/nickel transport system permease protein
MLRYIARRFVYMLFILLAVSVVSFLIIQLPPGDFLSSMIARLQASGTEVSQTQIEALTRRYHLDLPLAAQYLRWFGGLFRGNFGMSFQYNKPVAELIGERMALTVTVSLITLIFTFAVAIPIGIYSATRQYSFGDYAFSTFGFIGLATPNFLLAIILMFLFNSLFGISVGGLFSPEFRLEPWSLGKIWDMLKHLPVPIIVIGLAGTAGLIRVMRGCLLDELRKQYVITARAKGQSERTLLFRYPVRVALNPVVSTIGWALPAIVSGETITAIVLDLPTTGPLLVQALLNQDMYLAGSFVMLLSALTVVGTFVSDLLLVALDPRIRFEKLKR